MFSPATTLNNPLGARVAREIDRQVQHLDETEALAYLSRFIQTQSSIGSGGPDGWVEVGGRL